LRFCSKSFFGIAIFINGELQEEKEEEETIYKKTPNKLGCFWFWFANSKSNILREKTESIKKVKKKEKKRERRKEEGCLE